jgi:hypothetical protein
MEDINVAIKAIEDAKMNLERRGWLYWSLNWPQRPWYDTHDPNFN